MSSAATARAVESDVFKAEVFRTGEPVYFSGDRFTYNMKTGIVAGRGNVRVFHTDSRLRGDWVSIDLQHKTAEIEGEIEARRKGDFVEGHRGVYDFENQEGVFYLAQGYVDPWYVSADEAERETTGEFSFENASLTTCDPEHLYYQLRAGTVSVVPEERLVARNVRLYLGPVPVFYLPYYSMGLWPKKPPIDFTAGHQTDLGFYARLGYNIELNENVSVKPHIGLFTKSGVGGGVDGRLRLFDGAGIGRFDSFYISDQNDENTDERGIEKDRGKFDLYYRQELPYDWTALAQVEYITDRDFLKTFEFDEFSERELPETFLNLERTREHDVISITVRERLVDYIDDVERLPEVRYELLEQRIGDTGFMYSATADAAYLNIEPGGPDSTRLYTEGRLAHPLRFWEWLSVVPFAESNVTYYSDTLLEEDETRFTWDAGVVAQTRFHKVYGSPFSRYTAFRHLFVPTITYRFRPEPDNEPEELPQFDVIDAIDRENMVEVELRNYLQAKDKEGLIHDLVEYNFTAGFEFDDGQDTLAVVENELLVRPVPNWEFALKSLNDLRDERRADIVDADIRYVKPDSLKATIGILHEETLTEPVETKLAYSFSKAFGPRWRAGFSQRYDLRSDEFTYQELWIWRDLYCWEILFGVRDRREATSFLFEISLKGFPLERIERKTAMKPMGENNPWPTRW